VEGQIIFHEGLDGLAGIHSSDQFSEDVEFVVADQLGRQGGRGGLQATGRLVNGALAMPQALQVRANEGAFAPLSATGAALTLAAWSTPVGARPVTVEFKQPVAATDSLLTGSYGKPLTFTLSATTP
jgi:hypothetical protein